MGNLTRSKRAYLLLYPALLGLGAGALASCAGQQSPERPQTAAVRVSPPSQEMPPRSRTMPRPARKPTPPPPTGSPAPATGEESLAVTEPKPSTGSTPSPPAEPQSASSQVELLGLDQSAATRLFGQAAERLEEPPATVWRYKSATCELDLFFYLDLRSGRMRTLHYALKDGAGGAAQGQDCVRSLIASRAS